MNQLKLLQQEFPKVTWEYDSYYEVYEGKVNNTIISFCNVNCPDIRVEINTKNREVLKYLDENYCLIYLSNIRTLLNAINKVKCYLQESSKIIKDLI